MAKLVKRWAMGSILSGITTLTALAAKEVKGATNIGFGLLLLLLLLNGNCSGASTSRGAADGRTSTSGGGGGELGTAGRDEGPDVLSINLTEEGGDGIGLSRGANRLEDLVDGSGGGSGVSAENRKDVCSDDLHDSKQIKQLGGCRGFLVDLRKSFFSWKLVGVFFSFK